MTNIPQSRQRWRKVGSFIQDGSRLLHDTLNGNRVTWNFCTCRLTSLNDAFIVHTAQPNHTLGGQKISANRSHLTSLAFIFAANTVFKSAHWGFETPTWCWLDSGQRGAQMKSRISLPHPASAGKLPAASWTKLCSLFSIAHSHSNFNFTKHVSSNPPSRSLFARTLSIPFSLLLHLLFVDALQSVLLSCRFFLHAHMLLELNRWKIKGGGRRGNQVSSWESICFSSSSCSPSFYLWPQTVGHVTGATWNKATNMQLDDK